MVPAIPGLRIYDKPSFFLIAGPCVVENREVLDSIAATLNNVCDELQIPWILKASYRKANRSRLDSFTGIGDTEALEILAEVGKKHGVPVLTDVHNPWEADRAAAYVDVLQIPAFLCRQTDLLIAAGRTGKWINIKKGQFIAADQMTYAAEKVAATGNQHIMLTERGTLFGYHDLVVDFRSIPVMKKTGYAVVVDCTHAVQQPNQRQGVSGGQPEMIEPIARAAIAVGCDGIFLETHPEPSRALSDAATMLPTGKVRFLLERLQLLYRAVSELEHP
ncbi:MAG: 3-deoxy-8-phosphooctulonate synthase [Chitinophagales bacterium]|nr:3-deoxy-8-phosphooctulonate synthase [Chitinophagales bacterium]MDW8427073.1 3-deoxy-8-phosphooctulonate synthase [Chitinophagales bacterium]